MIYGNFFLSGRSMNFALRKKIGGRRQEGGSSNSTNIHLDLFREKLSRLGCYNILKRNINKKNWIPRYFYFIASSWESCHYIPHAYFLRVMLSNIPHACFFF